MQLTLSPESMTEFYYVLFVQDQVEDLRLLAGPLGAELVVVDLGGSVAYSSELLRHEYGSTRASWTWRQRAFADVVRAVIPAREPTRPRPRTRGRHSAGDG